MAAFDKVIEQNYLDIFYGYQGNPPTTEEEYLALNCWKEGTTPPSWAQIQEKMALVSVQQQRAKEYPKITDQLDMLWHAIDEGTLDKTSDFYTSLKAVKDEYPKP